MRIAKVRGKSKAIALAITAVVMTAAYGCGGNPPSGQGAVGSPHVLSASEAKGLLQQLPYRYQWRKVELPEGASDALAGTVIGKHHTIVHFGISLGTDAEAVPVPQAGARDPYDYTQGGGFSFTDDTIVPGGVGKQFHTGAQWDEATTMIVEMQEKLCKASTGKPCPP